MTDLPEITWSLAHGESLDREESVALAEAPPVGASFSLAIVAARGNDESPLRFDAPASITIGVFAAGEQPLAFHASAARIAQVAPGEYVGDLILDIPREGALGALRRTVAVVTLTLLGGTGS